MATNPKTLSQQIIKQQPLSQAHLAQLVQRAAGAPFALTLREADEPLWGTFWQFDVIAPGYQLPALELALLRASRLDGGWPQDTAPGQFLADLHAAVLHPQAGIWTLALGGVALAVFAAVTRPPLLTVVWYNVVAHQLQAGYRTPATATHLAAATEQRTPGFALAAAPAAAPAWLAVILDDETAAPAALDAAILHWRSQHP